MSKHTKFNFQSGRGHCLIELVNYACQTDIQLNNIICWHSIILYHVFISCKQHRLLTFNIYPSEHSSQINIQNMDPLGCALYLEIMQAAKQEKIKFVVTKVR